MPIVIRFWALKIAVGGSAAASSSPTAADAGVAVCSSIRTSASSYGDAVLGERVAVAAQALGWP